MSPGGCGETTEDDGFERADPFGFVIVDPGACPTRPSVEASRRCGIAVASLDGSVEVEACVVVPTGECDPAWIGDPYEGSSDREYTAGPRRRVMLTNYAMMRFPATVAQFSACVAAGACTAPVRERCGNVEDGLAFVGDFPGPDDHPMRCLDLTRAREFCSWVGGVLPSDAQYDYAASGPTARLENRPFPWGTDFVAGCHANLAPLPETNADPWPETSPVGFFDGSLHLRETSGWRFGPESFQTCDDSSPFGLHDLGGNVRIFTRGDGAEYVDFEDDEVDPVRIDPDAVVYRGSSWAQSAEPRHSFVYARDSICPPGHEPCDLSWCLPSEGQCDVRFDLTNTALAGGGVRCAFEPEP